VNGQIDDLPPLRQVVEKHGLLAKKSLGQNFLFDLNLTAKIARQAGPLEGHDVVEIGPGPGGLTRALLAGGARKVIAVEADSRCLPVLDEIGRHYPGALQVVHGDALREHYQHLVIQPARIIANLPYNVATPLLTGWLLSEPWPSWFSSMTLMFQKEVAERICAKPGSKAYGRLSVLAQWRTRAHIAFDVSAKAFFPPPKVTSSIVVLEPIANPLACEAANLERITQAAFGQRRKMLRSSLKSALADGNAEQLLEKADIDGERRAETLDVAEFVALANAL
jgi:16S rRNA (adenine1518-N6/adenine1519-N6)-dimethyltransferase